MLVKLSQNRWRRQLAAVECVDVEISENDFLRVTVREGELLVLRCTYGIGECVYSELLADEQAVR